MGQANYEDGNFMHCRGSRLLQRRAVLLSAAASVPLLTAGPAVSAPVAPFCGVTGVPSWAFTIPWEERLVDFAGHKTWVREVGKQEGGGGFFGLFGKGNDRSKGYRLFIPCVHTMALCHTLSHLPVSQIACFALGLQAFCDGHSK